MNVTPTQAQWILTRLMEDRRITQSEVNGYLADLGREIHELEKRLRALRDAGSAETNAKPHRPSQPKRTTNGKKGHTRGLAGTLIVLLRSIPVAKHARINAIRAQEGVKAAIAAARAVTKE